MRTHGHWRPLERAMQVYAHAGEHGKLWVGVCAAGALLDEPRRPLYRRSLKAVGLAYAANQAIKFAVRRPRPNLPGLAPLTRTITALSYPSAHTTTAFACAHTLSRALPAAPLYAAAAVMAAGRPYLGVHYPSDVLAVAALGTAVAELIR
jgi:membrane-associated phospholipid phosphatase